MTDWRPAPAVLVPPRGEVHVWRAPLDVGDAAIAARHAVLDEVERARAASYYFERDRRRFIVARGVVRAVLGRYLGVAPTALRFRLGTYGKPELVPPAPAFRFNVSHSGEVALLAVSDVELGVDVEHARRDSGDLLELATHSFSRAENAALRALPEADHRTAFFACWTRKEAYIKAIGMGLSMPLEDFSVSLVPGAAPALLDVATDPTEAARWTMRAFDAGPDYPCALAVRAHGLDVTFLDAF